jgi:uncharacterized protein YbaA (DUF1428 family)
MALYVDGYLLPLPVKNKAAYRKMASLGARIWLEHGALDYKECVGEDLRPKGVAHFTDLMKSKPGETVVLSYILYKSRRHRDQVNARVMKDPRMKMPPGGMPFEMKRMRFGGFEVLVDGAPRKKRK